MGKSLGVARLLPPESIRLPDGRQIALQPLLNAYQDYRVINLKTGYQYAARRQKLRRINNVDKDHE